MAVSDRYRFGANASKLENSSILMRTSKTGNANKTRNTGNRARWDTAVITNTAARALLMSKNMWLEDKQWIKQVVQPEHVLKIRLPTASIPLFPH
uniref:Transposase n=1 Tax=Steinernema glaseri TaxID=37863 RepID=A0A1I8A3A5_9BILA